MRIGFTERGDAGIDFSWYQKLNTVDGAVIITKRLSPECNRLLLTTSRPCILHCTCTGLGGTRLEPNVPAYGVQLDLLADLVAAGFPSERIVLRIDPVIPVPRGLDAAEAVLHGLARRKIPVSRIRFSVYDEYPHARDRLAAAGLPPFYPDGRFYASDAQMRQVADMLRKYPYVYETCAEDWAARIDPDRFVSRGCLSPYDLQVLGLDTYGNHDENRQRRSGCHCLGCKVELLSCKHRCPNQCMYCYWKD